MLKKNKPVRVGIDIRDLRVAKTGQKTVTEEFCKQFAVNKDTGIEFFFFDSPFSIYTGTKKWRILIEHIRYHYWKQVVLPLKAWRKGCDILFCGDYFAPYLHLGYQTIEIFYDAFFFEYPQHYNRLWLKLFHHIAMPAAKRCAYIMTITDYSKQKLNQLAGFRLEKLVTIYPAPKTLELTGTEVEKRIAPNERKYILHVGVMEKRKNIPALIKAFGLLIKKGYHDIDLVLVGNGNGKSFSDDSAQVFQTIIDCGLEKRVVCTGYLPDEEIGKMYSNAFMYVFPSINEGFGLPIMEAFRFDLPVLVADNSCLPEVGGDAVLTFNPYDTGDICHKMQQVIDNDQLREELIKKGKKRLQQFSWEKASAELIAIFKQAAGGKSKDR